MATMNPLERKARISFIKGLAIAGVIGVIVIVVLVIQLVKFKGEEKQRIDAQKTVSVLSQAVKSGDVVTSDMLKTEKADANLTPSDILTSSNFIEMSTDDSGNLKKVIAKIDIDANTILTTNMLVAEDNANTDDVRAQEYNMISLPSDIETGETVDVRLRMPDGTDYIVVSKKVVTVLYQGKVPSIDTISLQLSEGETLMMSNAIVEAYQIPGSKLYINKYVEPGMQAGAITTYVPSADVQNLIASDPNIVTTAKQELINRINSQGTLNRGNINDTLSGISQDDKNSDTETGTTDEITKQRDERQKYLDGLIQ